MNVTDLSSNLYVAPSTSLQPQPAAAGVPGAGDSSPDGDGGRVHHHGGHHGGGRMGGALMQALQSLGVSLPQASGSATSASSSGNDGDADDGNGSQSNGAGSIKGDMRSFMHALFQAVRSESTTASNGGGDASSGGVGADPKAGFSNGLSSLIAQVGNGSAPADLQSAFNQLMSDLGQGSGATAAGASGTSAGSVSAAASVSLQQLLTQMQQNLGYGPASTGASTGNLIGTSV